MKRIFTFLAAVLLTATVWAQTPQKMSYQAVVRDISDNLVTNQAVGMQISILQGSVGGTVVYTETQTPTTNANGLVSIEIGGGAGFSTIDWANDIYFIKTETDPTGGTNYTITGTSQLLSVPYALHAKTAESVTGTITETDPVFGVSTANGITSTDITNWNNKLDTEVDGSVTNEIQALSISNDTVYLSNGGFVKLPAGFDGQYSSLTGAPTTVSTFTNDAGYLTTEVDGSVTNEIQALSISNDTVYMSNGGFVKLPAADGSETKVTAGTNITVTGSGTIASPYLVSTTSGLRYLGEEYNGGIIYYLYIGSDGLQHGLIVSKTESTAQWQTSGTVTNATRTWDGAYNTSLMTASPAATYVIGLGAGWYLPSIDELSLLWHARFHVNKAMFDGGYTLLSNTARYWSSNEYDASNAYDFLFDTGEAWPSMTKTNIGWRVRAIRAF